MLLTEFDYLVHGIVKALETQRQSVAYLNICITSECLGNNTALGALCSILSLAYIVELAARHKVESEGYGHKQSYRYKGNNRRVDRESHEDKQHKETLAKDCGDRLKYARDKYQAHNIHIAVKHGGVASLDEAQTAVVVASVQPLGKVLI